MKRIVSFLTLVLFVAVAFGQFSVPKVLIEEHTGAWCGFCPDGALIMEDILATQPNAIGVAVHNNDAMEIAEGQELANFYGGGYPNATINRSGPGINRGSWASTAQNAAQGATAAEVSYDSLGFDPVDNVIYARVKVRFTGNLSGDMRINLLVVEDSVVGSGTGYNQSNYYSSSSQAAGGASHPYYNYPNPIQGYVHRHTLRAAIGGTWGIPGVIPPNVGFGDERSFLFTYALGAGTQIDMEQVSLVALVTLHGGTNPTDRPVLNAEYVHFLDNLTPVNSTAIEDPSFASEVKVYPNPASHRMTFTFNLEHTGMLKAEILDATGRKVADIANGSLNSGLHSLFWDIRDAQGAPVPNGMYLFRISSDNESLTRRVMVAR